MTALRELTKGLFKENPTFVLMLGICPTLAITTQVKNALAMGAAVIFVLVCSNVIISMLRKFIPSEIRIPCYIVIVASFVTMTELLMKAYMPTAIVAALGIFIPLIVVNCIILGRAEAFACKNTIFRSALDGIGIGIGFTLAVVLVSSIREILGGGAWMGIKIAQDITSVGTIALAPGAFLVLGLLLGFFNWMRRLKASKARRA
jgi:electron transport complex protein RnfE